MVAQLDLELMSQTSEASFESMPNNNHVSAGSGRYLNETLQLAVKK